MFNEPQLFLGIVLTSNLSKAELDVLPILTGDSKVVDFVE
jgi:hypothetical protein